jgi:hypothetical protein
MDLIQGREPLLVVPPKVSVETLVGVDAQELAHHFHGEHFGVGELRLGASLADALSVEPIVDEAKDDDDKVSRSTVGLHMFGDGLSAPNAMEV